MGIRANYETVQPVSLDNRYSIRWFGVEQARKTGEWLREQPEFDRFYVSPHIRTRETAASFELGGEWRVDDRFRERDWGMMYSHKDLPEDVVDPQYARIWAGTVPILESFGTPVRSDETFVEATYQYQLTPWAQLQPDLQYVFNPGAGIANPNNPTSRVRNELVFGVRANLSL